jgi:chemotaxis protein CheD
MASVRMGEIAVSRDPAEELLALGLGSCIGLAIVDRIAGVAGLAHVVLPESRPGVGPAGKFADLAVPELIRMLLATGAVSTRFETAMVGGARMFELRGGLDIGSRNDQAVRAALAQARVTVHAADTGGNLGRTIRVDVGAGIVTARSGGAQMETLLPGRRAARAGVAPRAASGLRPGLASVSGAVR